MFWKTEKRFIKDLNPSPYNPRKMSAVQEEDLRKSLDKFSLAAPIIVNLDNTIIGGHQRLKILKTQNIEEIEVRVPERLLLPDEEKELNLRLNKNNADWDDELLKEIDRELLENVGFLEKELDEIFSIEADEKEKEIMTSFEVIIICENENEQQEIYEKVSKGGMNCRLLTL